MPRLFILGFPDISTGRRLYYALVKAPARSWAFTVRSGLRGLVVEPASHSWDDRLLIAQSASFSPITLAVTGYVVGLAALRVSQQFTQFYNVPMLNVVRKFGAVVVERGRDQLGIGGVGDSHVSLPFGNGYSDSCIAEGAG